jgi:hypothetical protein
MQYMGYKRKGRAYDPALAHRQLNFLPKQVGFAIPKKG